MTQQHTLELASLANLASGISVVLGSPQVVAACISFAAAVVTAMSARHIALHHRTGQRRKKPNNQPTNNQPY